MKTKIKNKNKNKNKNINKISFIIALFFALTQVSQANVVLGASISAGEMIRLTNESRLEAELPLLLVNEKLTEAAMEKADDMLEFQYFDHNSPSGLTPWDFIRSAGYDYIYAGENLAIDFVTANGAHKALMESASHRENILNSNYTEIGIAVMEGMFDGNKSIIIVEEFGTSLGKEAVADHSLNENIELILEEKADEANDLKDNNKEEGKLEKLSQTGSTLESGANIEQEYGASRLEEGSVNEQDNDLFICHLDPSAVGEGRFDLENLCYLKSNEANIEYNPILLAENLNNKKVMGLINKADAKDEHIKKYDYQQNSAGPAVNNYFQKEFIESVLLFYAILAVLLISDFVVTIHFYNKKEYNC